MRFLLTNYFIKVKFNLSNRKNLLTTNYAVRVMSSKGPRYIEIISFSLWGRTYPEAKELDSRTLYKIILRNIQKYYPPEDIGNIIIDGMWMDVKASAGSKVFETKHPRIGSNSKNRLKKIKA